MKSVAPYIATDEALERVRIGNLVTTRDEDNVGTKHLIAHPIAVEALERQPGLGNILSVRSELGQAIFNARVGEERTYRRRNGGKVSVWIVLIENAPTIYFSPAPEPVVSYAVAA